MRRLSSLISYCPLNPWGLTLNSRLAKVQWFTNLCGPLKIVQRLRTDRASELGYVAEAIQRVVTHFKDRIGIIGFCGAPFTLASYMIEGGSSRNYIAAKTMMYRQPDAWRMLMEKLVCRAA